MAKQGILEGIGEFIGGVGEHLGTGLKSVRDAERAKLAAPGLRNEANELSQLLQTYKAIDPSQTEQRNQVLQRITATPTFQKFQGTVGPLAKSQIDKSNAFKEAGTLSRALSSAEDFISPELRTAGSKAIAQKFANAGIVPEQSTEVTGMQKVQLSSLFSEGLKSLKKSSKGNLATTEETQAFANKFKIEAAKAGASPTAAAALFGELHDQETGKRGTFRNDVLPKGSNASMFFPSETAKGTGSQGPPDPKQDIKAFEEFTQVGTEEFPTDNTPKPRAALGITEIADQQAMQEIEKAAPRDLDIQAIAQQDPEAFKQILSALRKGTTPSGKPFTIKDALKMMGQI